MAIIGHKTLGQWFDLSKPISEEDLKLREAEMVFFSQRDDDIDRIKNMRLRLRAAVEEHNAGLVEPRKLHRQTKLGSRKHVLQVLKARAKAGSFRCQAKLIRKEDKFIGVHEILLLGSITDLDTEERIASEMWFKAGEWSEGLELGQMFKFTVFVDKYTDKGEAWSNLLFVPFYQNWRISRA